MNKMIGNIYVKRAGLALFVTCGLLSSQAAAQTPAQERKENANRAAAGLPPVYRITVTQLKWRPWAGAQLVFNQAWTNIDSSDAFGFHVGGGIHIGDHGNAGVTRTHQAHSESHRAPG